jgi:hypothetical protein
VWAIRLPSAQYAERVAAYQKTQAEYEQRVADYKADAAKYRKMMDAGAWNWDGAPINLQDLIASRDKLEHRGPDDAGH